MSGAKNSPVVAAALCMFLLSVYFLTYSGTVHSSDGLSMLAVTDSLVKRGHWDTGQVYWLGLQQGTFGREGELYSRKGLGLSLLAVPLAWLGLVVRQWGAVQTTLLLNSFVTALTGVLVLLYAELLGYSPGTSLMAVLFFGLGTMAWPYAKYFFSDPLAGLGVFASAYFLLRYKEVSSLFSPFLAGAGLGLAVVTRLANAVTIPLFLALLIVYSGYRPPQAGWRKGARRVRNMLVVGWKPLLLFLLPLSLSVLLVGGYNYLRFGDIWQTGYRPEESFSAPLMQGVLGLLISPGRGLFLYSPILALTIIAFPTFFRRHRLEAGFGLLLFLAYLLLYGKWFMWHGGFAWGPRFMVPTIPFLVLAMAPLLEGLWKGSRSAFYQAAVVSFLLFSLAVQLLGLSVPFGLYQMTLEDTGLPLFDPATFFEWRYSPLWGQLSFLERPNLDFAWMHEGRLDAVALGLSLAGVTFSAAVLVWQYRRASAGGLPGRSAWSPVMAAGLVLMVTTALSLARYRESRFSPYSAVADFIQTRSRAGEVILFNNPLHVASFMNNYKGSLPLYGLNEGGPPLSSETEQLLPRLVDRYQLFWLVSDYLPATESALDLWLAERGFLVLDRDVDHQRLAVYFLPQGPLSEYRTAAVFGKVIALEGYALSPTTAAGEVLPLKLHFRSLAAVDRDYQVFVHLLDSADQLWAQDDGTPQDGLRPTSTWQVGERVEDRHALWLPSDIPAGQYFLKVGLYRLSDGGRLSTADGTDSVNLGPIKVISSRS